MSIAPWLFLVVIGLVLVIAGGRGLRFLAQPANWPRVPALIRESTVKEVAVSDRFRWTEYIPYICYSYEVEGERRLCCNYSIDRHAYRYPRKAKAAALAEQFPVGAKTEVFVSPSDPSVAVLTGESDTRRRSHFMAVSVAGLLLIVIGVFGAYTVP